MIVVNGKVVEFNTYEQAAAVQVGFPFNHFRVKRIGRNGYLRVTFHSDAQCNMWKRRISDAMPADTAASHATG